MCGIRAGRCGYLLRGASRPDAAGDITAGLDAAGWRLAELHIDRAHLSSELVRDRDPELAVFCKAWRVRNTGGRFAKDQFSSTSPPGS